MAKKASPLIKTIKNQKNKDAGQTLQHVRGLAWRYNHNPWCINKMRPARCIVF